MKSGLLVASDDGIQTEKWAAEKAERRLSKGGLPLKEDKDGGASLWKNRALLPAMWVPKELNCSVGLLGIYLTFLSHLYLHQ